ncbi:hypothetical protein H4219_005493 [Mycoemilia scoparia]|uniref:Uncharacterized protein n=1 Tax=Mycoemilia scoparia TaxID=417184 RepID=A0A9W8DP75_9FUNG|nr:hypothetical protein H4219_005493 [Mycoemilia scoparia]
MGVKNPTSDKGIACQVLFSQFLHCIMLLLNPIHYGKHGATEDGLKCLRYVLGIFLWSADENFSNLYREFIEGKTSYAHFKAVFTDFHHNVLRQLICMYYPNVISIAKFGNSRKLLDEAYEHILIHIEEGSHVLNMDCCRSIFKDYQDFYHEIFQGITGEKFVDPQKIDDYSNGNNITTGVVADITYAGKKKILAFFKDCLFKKANSAIDFYETVESGDQSILRDQFMIFQEPFTKGIYGPNADFIQLILKSRQDGVQRNAISRLIGEFLSDYRKK